MQNIEPYFYWISYYEASQDENSPFFGRTYSEFEYTNSIYNYAIHPQWDEVGSESLFIKILYSDYQNGFSVIEMMGEWNDCIQNDIMFLKRNVLDILIAEGINKFILIGENVFNFHVSDDSYYEEWFDEIEDGWIVGLNFREHVKQEFRQGNIDYLIHFGGQFDEFNWRKFLPAKLFIEINNLIQKRIS